ncbi:hypothetical protein C8J57DRAFT_1229900 [Mycena rebaudengoi]|nr:hypothetical protein C8J57DRAFT_1229900 [Mycena rebaudengoi]
MTLDKMRPAFEGARAEGWLMTDADKAMRGGAWRRRAGQRWDVVVFVAARPGPVRVHHRDPVAYLAGCYYGGIHGANTARVAKEALVAIPSPESAERGVSIVDLAWELLLASDRTGLRTRPAASIRFISVLGKIHTVPAPPKLPAHTEADATATGTIDAPDPTCVLHLQHIKNRSRSNPGLNPSSRGLTYDFWKHQLSPQHLGSKYDSPALDFRLPVLDFPRVSALCSGFFRSTSWLAVIFGSSRHLALFFRPSSRECNLVHDSSDFQAQRSSIIPSCLLAFKEPGHFSAQPVESIPFSGDLRRRYFDIFVPARWLAKPTKWLASRNAGFGLVMPPKSKPKPETNHSARAQATFASQKVNSPGLDARGPLRGYLAAAAQRVGWAARTSRLPRPQASLPIEGDEAANPEEPARSYKPAVQSVYAHYTARADARPQPARCPHCTNPLCAMSEHFGGNPLEGLK